MDVTTRITRMVTSNTSTAVWMTREPTNKGEIMTIQEREPKGCQGEVTLVVHSQNITPDMIERGARAICKLENGQWDNPLYRADIIEMAAACLTAALQGGE